MKNKEEQRWKRTKNKEDEQNKMNDEIKEEYRTKTKKNNDEEEQRST